VNSINIGFMRTGCGHWRFTMFNLGNRRWEITNQLGNDKPVIHIFLLGIN